MEIKKAKDPSIPNVITFADGSTGRVIKSELLPPEIREGIEKNIADLYLSQKAQRILSPPAGVSDLQRFAFPSPISLHPAKLNLKPFILAPKTEFAMSAANAGSDYLSKLLTVEHPQIAVSLGGVGVFVGAYGCLSKMMQPEKYNRWRRTLCVSDVALSILLFLGKIFPIPQLTAAQNWFLGVKFVIKVSDTWVEKMYKANDPNAQKLLEAISSGKPIPSDVLMTARQNAGTASA
jgi:hypothetical protein